MSTFLEPLFARGFFDSTQVHAAVLVGGLVALACGAVGVFTVLRGQAFASHAFGDMSTVGSSGAFLAGAGPLWGLMIVGVAAAAAMELIGVQRARGRDLATGIVLGAGLGIAALLIYLNSTEDSTTGVTITILFGSVFAIDGPTIPLAVVLSAGVAILVAALYRPLLLSSLSPELAAARGVPTRLIGFAYLVALALAVALSALTIGTVLATALVIGPAATALRLTRRPLRAMLVAGALGVATLWIGVVLAYDSYGWSGGKVWPVSFFVVTLVLALYVVSAIPGRLALRRRTSAAGAVQGR
jgi:zinc/manganese transport system permease protein